MAVGQNLELQALVVNQDASVLIHCQIPSMTSGHDSIHSTWMNANMIIVPSSDKDIINGKNHEEPLG